VELKGAPFSAFGESGKKSTMFYIMFLHPAIVKVGNYIFGTYEEIMCCVERSH
jgi:hypothetical protein